MMSELYQLQGLYTEKSIVRENLFGDDDFYIAFYLSHSSHTNIGEKNLSFKLWTSGSKIRGGEDSCLQLCF